MVVLLIRIMLICLSWSTIFFLPIKSIKRFLPVTLFSSIILLVETLLANSHKWWKVKGGAKASTNNALTFIFGPFFVGNLWVFHLTYGKFWLYSLLNVFNDLMLAFPLNRFFEKFNLYKLKRFKPKHLFLTAFSYSLLNYLFQFFIEGKSPRKYNQ
ncbi:hypothetical protein M3685_17260 [Heyndrickxia oleronia]|uniref:hypothetical protein n=1 Tax=Heyndrickxia TaxID=2837504 RepID=UPI00071724B5|nr:hypothetical protein [Heyndrickxia oleronia]MCM3455678.1 hypothetical protein [Heyndrickxia oleronia]MEC1375597.1 hypothetical protein [Heyndrickxia oleronia]NYV66915.1 hypothetical protein [Bacillus sp. Gen3]QQZ05190.1 hypothetical protein I5818_01245 [Heyndrickxia oleronia]